MDNKLKIEQISKIAILSMIGALLMYFDFPLPIAPSFYKIDFSDLPGLIGGFALGPISALFIQIVTIIIKLILKPTSTAFVGELSSFIISSFFCVSAAYFYHKNRTRKGAIVSIVIASTIQVVTAAIVNYFLIIPAYVSFMNIPLEVIVSMGTKIIPIVKDKLSLVLLCTVPFNLIKVIIIDILTIMLYKRVSPLLRRNRA